MIFFCKNPVRFFDFIICGALTNSEHLIIISFLICHIGALTFLTSRFKTRNGRLHTISLYFSIISVYYIVIAGCTVCRGTACILALLTGCRSARCSLCLLIDLGK